MGNHTSRRQKSRPMPQKSAYRASLILRRSPKNFDFHYQRRRSLAFCQFSGYEKHQEGICLPITLSLLDVYKANLFALKVWCLVLLCCFWGQVLFRAIHCRLCLMHLCWLTCTAIFCSLLQVIDLLCWFRFALLLQPVFCRVSMQSAILSDSMPNLISDKT